MSKNLTEALIVERYKFIQKKQMYLDKALHTNIGVLIKILSGVFTLFFAIGAYYFKDTSIISSTNLLLLFKVVVGFSLILLLYFLLVTISNVVAWFNYRKDEVALLTRFGGDFQREEPKISNFLSWQETWFCILILVFILMGGGALFYSTEIVDSFIIK
ncbi:TPA: hypothetical protein VEO38_002600 [Providencia alcalifaciens]|nr:hypothetical protein [Providencia alcalifaciens]